MKVLVATAVATVLGSTIAFAGTTVAPQEVKYEDGTIAVSLTGMAGNAADLRAILVNPKLVFSGTTMMPSFYVDTGLYRVRKQFVGKTILTGQQVEDLVAYMLTLTDSQDRETVA